MKNMTIFANLIDGYNTYAFTHRYIYGFCDRGTVYACFATADVMPYVLTLDKASRGCGYALRFKPNKAQKEMLKTGECIALCTVEYFNDVHANCKYNKGEVFEKLVTEYFGQTWEKDNVPFYVDGDITVDGVAYQIKFEKATFINEKGMANLEK